MLEGVARTCSPLALVGPWQMSRTVEDRRSGLTGRVDGTTELAEEGPGRVRWAEEGTFAWDGGVSPVTRTLFVVRRDGGWWVTFEDGRDFHPWAPGEPVEHPCAADLYRGLVETSDERPVRSWRVRWEVTGPAKDHTIHTELTRLPGG